MLRTLLALLVLANVLFFGWAQGWLTLLGPAPRQAEREPGRIGAQVQPELIVLLQPSVAQAALGAAKLAAVACMEAGPYSDAEIGAAEAALAAAGLPAGSWSREQVQLAAGWVVFAGRYADAGARKAREDELRRLKLPFETIDAPADLAPGLVVSRHASRDAAELALAAVVAGAGDRPVSGMRVAAVPPPPLQHWLRAPAADGELQARLFALDRGFRPCAGPR